MLAHGLVHDPGIGFVTLTRVKVSPDLQVSQVYYTILGDQHARRETARALDRATPFLRRELGKRIRLRRVPELTFRFDETVGYQDQVEQILHTLHEEDAARKAEQPVPEAPADPAARTTPTDVDDPQ